MARNSDPSSKSSFPTVGIANATQFSNASGKPSANTKRRPKKLAGGGGFLAAATATHRKGIKENMGAQLHPSATLYEQNAAESGAVKKNVKLLPPVFGQARNFWAQ